MNCKKSVLSNDSSARISEANCEFCFRTQVRSLPGLVINWLSDASTFLKLGWCDPGWLSCWLTSRIVMFAIIKHYHVVLNEWKGRPLSAMLTSQKHPTLCFATLRQYFTKVYAKKYSVKEFLGELRKLRLVGFQNIRHINLLTLPLNYMERMFQKCNFSWSIKEKQS